MNIGESVMIRMKGRQTEICYGKKRDKSSKGGVYGIETNKLSYVG